MGQFLKTIATALAVADSKTLIADSEFSVHDHNNVTFYVDYTKGSETGLVLYFYGLHTSGGDEFPLGKYKNADGLWTPQGSPGQAEFTTTGKQPPLSFDVDGLNYVNVYQVKKGGTVSGTFDLSAVKTNK